jgi:phosphoglycerate dehydrogenase-like enzyme
MHRNVILTSHQAFFTNLALNEIASSILESVDLVESGEKKLKTEIFLQKDGKIVNG